MKQTTPDNESLGDVLTDLSNSATGLSANVQALKRAMNDLETSTERWSENQAAASESLTRAAENIASSGRDGPTVDAEASSSGFDAVADD
jgi:hypothetical protein